MEINAANAIARVQSAIDGITRWMTDVEQQLRAIQNANSEATLLQEELAMSQAERRAVLEQADGAHRGLGARDVEGEGVEHGILARGKTG